MHDYSVEAKRIKMTLGCTLSEGAHQRPVATERLPECQSLEILVYLFLKERGRRRRRERRRREEGRRGRRKERKKGGDDLPQQFQSPFPYFRQSTCLPNSLAGKRVYRSFWRKDAPKVLPPSLGSIGGIPSLFFVATPAASMFVVAS